MQSVHHTLNVGRVRVSAGQHWRGEGAVFGRCDRVENVWL